VAHRALQWLILYVFYTLHRLFNTAKIVLFFDLPNLQKP